MKEPLATMAETSKIALSFFALKAADFSYIAYRKRLAPGQEAVPGTRNLPVSCEAYAEGPVERHRYEVSLQPRAGFEQVRVAAWVDQGLTIEALHTALVIRTQDSDLRAKVELEEDRFRREVAFVLAQHGDVREVMWLRAYALQAKGKFGFLCHFALRVPKETDLTARLRLELSLTHKNGRSNQDFYLDHNQKLEDFVRHYFANIASLTLHDGSIVELEPRLSVVKSFALARRTYVFQNDREAGNQFFGLRDIGPYRPVEAATRLVFVFKPEDREQSQHLFRALRGDLYSTFPGMQSMFGVAIGRENVSGIPVSGFTNKELLATCDTLKRQFPNEHILPVALVPFSKHSSDEETAGYFSAKHAFISQGLASQFVDRKQTLDRNALKWSISNISLALFAKMGGVPWRIKPSTNRCLIVGIGQAHRSVERHITRYIAYSVLADSAGGYETIKVLGDSTNEGDYLRALRQNLRQVLQSHKAQYDSFVLHVTFNMRRHDIDAIKELLEELKGEGPSHEFVAIKFNDKNEFFGFSLDHNSRVPYEGTVMPLSKREFLMWFSGLGLADAKVPKQPERPVHLRILFPESPLPEADLKRVLQDAMNIAGANWRGFNAKSMPISVYYAKIIATYYARFREGGLPDVDFENVSPWFL
ncbi:Piwi domain-containing protein [Acidisphaera sp. S103]|uniref:Piwi domain-containing protein n=1 Tax=Acidisphaera sp. S103 TaxID=1747223 RepID=UPI00131B56A1|nr:Piwi domain-containing protein [Acidisphaera sp. S103]